MEKLLFNNDSSVGELLQKGEQFLSASSSPRLDSEVLLAHALACSRSSLIVRLRDLCSSEARSVFQGYLARRATGEPVAYILGEKEFWKFSFQVSPAVLVPRPESELLVEEALQVLRDITAPKLIDLGTGSGCLVISIVKELLRAGRKPGACVAVDCSVEALKVAESNARCHGVSDYITFVRSDWFEKREVFSPPYDLIVANPPYIPPDEKVPVELSFEPKDALFSAEQGLRDVKRIVAGGLEMLAPSGVILCEVGAGKRAELRDFFAVSYPDLQVAFLGDDSDEDRFTVIRAQRLR